MQESELPKPSELSELASDRVNESEEGKPEGGGEAENIVALPSKSFRIIEESEVRLPGREEGGLVARSCETSHTHESPDADYKLFFEPGAFRQLTEHIGIGINTPSNVVEQGGLLAGIVFRETTSQETWGIVLHVLPGWSADGSTTHLRLTHDTWLQMLQSFDTIETETDETELRIIGWYHTHPNKLRVFMSSTDLATQARYFKEDWQFAVVFNPHSKVWRVFHGNHGRECIGFILEEDSAHGAG